jgi:hypothetical protein
VLGLHLSEIVALSPYKLLAIYCHSFDTRYLGGSTVWQHLMLTLNMPNSMRTAGAMFKVANPRCLATFREMWDYVVAVEHLVKCCTRTSSGKHRSRRPNKKLEPNLRFVVHNVDRLLRWSGHKDESSSLVIRSVDHSAISDWSSHSESLFFFIENGKL